MISKFDIQKLNDLNIEDVADALGLTVKRHKSLCPFHDDSHPSLTFSTSRNRYRCYVCDARGGTIDLVMNTQHWTFYDSCKWLGLTSISSPVPMSGNPNGTWFNAPSLLIPYRDIDGRLLSVQARYLGNSMKNFRDQFSNDFEERSDDPKPRFQFPKGSRCSIYNLPVLQLLREGEPLFVTEGCSDCWSMLSSGHKAIAIPSATLLSRKDIELLKSLNSQPSSLNLHFAMFPDNDEPGERLFLQLQKVLPNLVHYQLPSGCKDFSELYLTHLKLGTWNLELGTSSSAAMLNVKS